MSPSEDVKFSNVRGLYLRRYGIQILLEPNTGHVTHFFYKNYDFKIRLSFIALVIYNFDYHTIYHICYYPNQRNKQYFKETNIVQKQF